MPTADDPVPPAPPAPPPPAAGPPPAEIPPAEIPPLIRERRLRVFLLLSGIFLGTLAMLNILGISRFIVFGTLPDGLGWFSGAALAVAVGVLPYPVTFLCTDLLSEFFGRKRANWVVIVGLVLNLWVVAVLWLGGALFPPEMDPATGMPPLPTVNPETGKVQDFNGFSFYYIRALTFGAVTASMIAYLAAQLCDVYLFHFWKRLTKGKHLWLRNNGSTLISQAVDTTAVILITHFYAHALPIKPDAALWPQLIVFIGTGYVFKLVAALLDTPLIYAAVAVLGPYLHLDPTAEHRRGLVVGHSES